MSERDATQQACLQGDLFDTLDEELEMEIDDHLLDDDEGISDEARETQRMYFRELLRLQGGPVKLQDWVIETGHRLVVIFEGRGAAGKGGIVKHITRQLNPWVCRVAVLPALINREHIQWYFQRYVAYLPAVSEIVLFNCSWYNRVGIERVVGSCTDEGYEKFFRSVPKFEKMLAYFGIQIIKYWFSVTDGEQEVRFQSRIDDPLKQWKLSPMDLESRRRWEVYMRAKEMMLERPHIPESPWWVVLADGKRRARLSHIHHLLGQVPYHPVPHSPVPLPEHVHHAEYVRRPVPKEMIVPDVY